MHFIIRRNKTQLKMKDFFKYTLATITGIVALVVITGIFALISIVGMISTGESSQKVKDNSVFVLKLSGDMEERSQDNFLSELSDDTNTIGLDDVLKAIDNAKKNNKIKGIYIEAGTFSPDSYASLQAMRNALNDFKKSGKWIIAYGDVYTQGAYYVCSVANKVYLNPVGLIDWHGLAAEPYYIKDMLAKLGVKVQLFKVGTYKSMPETYTANKMSDANREQVSAYIRGIWNTVCNDVSKSRGIGNDKLNSFADNYITLADAKEYVSNKMVDGLLYNEQVKDKIKKLLNTNSKDAINQLSLNQMINIKSDNNDGGKIAVYYAYGNVVSSDITEGGSPCISSEKVDADLEKLKNDDDVKAVVIRVNSGGGSSFASEQIWHAVEMLKAKKPVVISMGGMAASGAYYLSCGANWIVAEPTTLTGSIGIFGMIPDISGLLTQKLGVRFDVEKTNRGSDFGSIGRPFNVDESKAFQASIDRGYILFRSRVANGRNMKVTDVEKIAQGHVWLGETAIKLHLVDQLGGIDAAIAKAAKLAKIDKSGYYTESYPEKVSWIDQILNSSLKKGSNYLDENLKSTLGEYYEPLMLVKKLNKTDRVQARIPFAVNIK